MPTPLHVLILEDSPTDAEVMVRHLREAGYAPDWERAETESEFLAHLDPTLDLILIDYTLPEWSGGRALEILRDRGWDIPAIIVTGTISEEAALEPLQLGAADYLLKDRLTRLGAAVRSALAQRTTQHERVATEEALRESEARYRLLFENSIDAVLLATPDGRILAANPEACRLFGRSEKEVCHAGRAGLVDPASPRLPELLEERRRTGKTKGELIFVRKDGTRFPGEISSAVFIDRDGIPKTSMIIRDITERKRAEESLVRERDYSRTLVEGANAVVVGLDREGRITLWNPAAERLTGYARAELQGKDWFEVLVPRTRYPQVWDEFLRLTKGGLPGEFENPILTKSGEERIIAWRTSHLREGDTITGFISFGMDITERKRAEATVRESEDKLSEAQRLARIGSWDWDVETDSMIWSKELYSIFGKSPHLPPPSYEECHKFGPPESWACLDSAVKESLKTGAPYELELEFLRGDGTTGWINARGMAVQDESGRTVRLRGTVQDITERKRAELVLKERTRQLEALREVTSEIARELNLIPLLDLVCRRATELIGVTQGAIHIWDDADQRLVIRAMMGFDEKVRHIRLRRGEGVAGAVVECREGLVVNDYAHSPYAHPFFIERGLSGPVLCEPLLYRDRLLGTILLAASPGDRLFTGEDQQVLRLFAAQAAVAIENARLYEVERERRRELEAIRAVTAEITRELDLNVVLRLVTQRAVELLATASGAVFLWEEESQSLIPRAQHGHDWPASLPLRLGEGVAGTVAERREGMIVNSYSHIPLRTSGCLETDRNHCCPRRTTDLRRSALGGHWPQRSNAGPLVQRARSRPPSALCQPRRHCHRERLAARERPRAGPAARHPERAIADLGQSARSRTGSPRDPGSEPDTASANRWTIVGIRRRV